MHKEIQEILLSSAATTLNFLIDHFSVPTTNPKKYAANFPELQELGRSFVTVYFKGKTAGCMGSLDRRYSLWEDVKQNVRNAAYRDLRYAPIVRWQLAQIGIGISVLGNESQIQVQDIPDAVAASTGILVRLPSTEVRAILLPFANRTMSPKEIVATLRRKAGIADGIPTESLTFYSVETTYFAEMYSNIPQFKLGAQ